MLTLKLLLLFIVCVILIPLVLGDISASAMFIKKPPTAGKILFGWIILVVFTIGYFLIGFIWEGILWIWKF